ncbi:TPA: hypothetical protein PPH57_005227 [Escherichia coli]|nr:hypothetical protein [Escherichia coli]HDJ0209591.1 hypothetical protein [Escherichia coli]HEB3840184.1 hypothetical protein [Escherichia coli]
MSDRARALRHSPPSQGFTPTPRISAYVLNVTSGSLPLPRPLAHSRSVAGAAASGTTSRMLSAILLLFCSKMRSVSHPEHQNAIFWCR